MQPTFDLPNAETIETMIEGTVFRNEENGYSVVMTRMNKSEICVVGTLPTLAQGEQVLFTGTYVEHKQYGKQFKATNFEILKPTTLRGIERFLASGLIKGLGPKTAKLIVQEFGTKALDIMSENPLRLTEISGIGSKKALMISMSFEENYTFRDILIFLQSYSIPPYLSLKIAKKYGQKTRDLMYQNPYKLIDDIDGVGFLTADRIAMTIGLSVDGDFRIQYGIKYVLEDASLSNGHTYLPMDFLIRKSKEMLRVSEDIIQHHISKLLLNRDLISSTVQDVTCIFTQNAYYSEVEIAVRLLALSQSKANQKDNILKKRVQEFEKENHIQFSDLQKKAVIEATKSGVFVITGGPGTGKTTIINCILYLLQCDNEKAFLVAPTGRAAKRMTEATKQEAKTLHRLLEFNGDSNKFMRNQDNPLTCDCVIIDEMSMVDVYLMRHLLKALRKGTRLILVGDSDQLPSVGAGNVLHDILNSDTLPYVRLTDIFRQAEESLIVLNAHKINQGQMPVLNNKNKDFFFDRRMYAEESAKTIVDLCTHRLPSFLRLKNGLSDIQVLSPTKKGVCGVMHLNTKLQESLNPPSMHKKQTDFGGTIFRVHDKVMHIKNNYDIEWTTDDHKSGQGVFNGEIGFIENIDLEDHLVIVRYDDKTVAYDYSLLNELEHAYCLSVHKSQGSEFPVVVLPVVGGPKMLLTRNLFYTALTRAKKMVVLVGREDAVYEMVHNTDIKTRYTTLEIRLREVQEPCIDQIPSL